MYVVGISSLKQNTSAALLHDGVVEAAIENDKLLRHASRGLPKEALRFCVEKAGIDWKDVGTIAVATKPTSAWARRTMLRGRLSAVSPVASAYYEAGEISSLARTLNDIRILRRNNDGSTSNVVSLDHHRCHAAHAFYTSPFEKALIITMDEDGDGIATTISLGEAQHTRLLKRIAFPHSLAWVYSQVTELLGFVPRQEEHKVQWLSVEGEPVCKDVFVKMFRHNGSPLPRLDFTYFRRGLPGRVAFSGKFYRETGVPERKPDFTDEHRRTLAASIQQAFAQIVGDLIQHYTRQYGVQQICLSGGFFLNSLLVSDLEKQFGLGQIFVPPAPGNAGSAIGAALLVWHEEMEKPRANAVPDAYVGPRFRHQDIKEVLDNCKSRYSLQNTEVRKVSAAVQLLQAGKIIGWYQGATEFGPRALGHRSVLASPWAPYVKENLNDYIKHREWFRPFAIAVPEEDSHRYFEASNLCRFMNSLGVVRDDCNVLPEGMLLPGRRVRLQVVERRSNPLFWNLLKTFGEHAPAPILLNTSFNLFGEPLVVKPRDAIRSYFCSGIDALVIDNFVLSKSAIALNTAELTTVPIRIGA